MFPERKQAALLTFSLFCCKITSNNMLVAVDRVDRPPSKRSRAQADDRRSTSRDMIAPDTLGDDQRMVFDAIVRANPHKEIDTHTHTHTFSFISTWVRTAHTLVLAFIPVCTARVILNNHSLSSRRSQRGYRVSSRVMLARANLF